MEREERKGEVTEAKNEREGEHPTNFENKSTPMSTGISVYTFIFCCFVVSAPIRIFLNCTTCFVFLSCRKSCLC